MPVSQRDDPYPRWVDSFLSGSGSQRLRNRSGVVEMSPLASVVPDRRRDLEQRRSRFCRLRARAVRLANPCFFAAARLARFDVHRNVTQNCRQRLRPWHRHLPGRLGARADRSGRSRHSCRIVVPDRSGVFTRSRRVDLRLPHAALLLPVRLARRTIGPQTVWRRAFQSAPRHRLAVRALVAAPGVAPRADRHLARAPPPTGGGFSTGR